MPVSQGFYGIPHPETLGLWWFRKQITIAPTSDGALVNYVMRLYINRSVGIDSGNNVYVGTKCLANYNDIRFTASDGKIPLCYWIETYSDSQAMVWIRFDSIKASPNNTIFYLYYGNVNAAAYSSGVKTFPVFDDFDGPTLNTTLWTQRGGVATFSGSTLILTGNNTNESKLMANLGGAKNFVLRTRGKINALYRLGVSVETDITNGRGYCYLIKETELKFYFLDDTVAWGSTYDAAAVDTYYLMEIWHDGTNIKAAINDGAVRSWARTGRGGTLALSSSQSTSVATFDWAFIRYLSPTEPTWSAWGNEDASTTDYQETT